jgi:glucose-6-phosphate dehydrogenase assembly protein OpcA
VTRHPSRVIVLHHDAHSTLPNAPIAASVGVLMAGPRDARFGIEHIAVRSVCCEDSLPSIVRALTLGDVPTSVWWTEDLSDIGPLGSLLGMARQLIYDSRGWTDVKRGVQALQPFVSPAFGPHLMDINWRRLTQMRHALMHAIQASQPQGSRLAVQVRHRPGEASLAWLLAGWLIARLPAAVAETVVAESAALDDVVTVSIDHGASGSHDIVVTLSDREVSVEERAGPGFTLPVVVEGEADAVVAELASLTDDVCLRDAISALARHFSAP